LTCNAAYWLRVLPLLADLRVITVDFRGHGLSGHCDTYRYDDYENDLEDVVTGLELDGFTVAGHSLGGYVALRASIRDDRIAAVLAVDVKSDWSAADAELAERSRTASQRVEPDRNVVVDRLLRTLSPVTLAGAELDEFVSRSIEAVDGGWRLRWDRRVLATEPVDPFAFLSDVPCKATVIAGSHSDVMPPSAAERFAAAIPNARLEVVDGAGHHVELEAPDRVAQAIRALT
jgi:pimeloyl-ACP methyl ester carboxylesterase